MRFYLVDSAHEIEALICWHNKHSEFVVLDLETTSKNPREAKLLDIQMSGKEPDEVVMFDGKFLPLLQDLNVTQVWQNFKYDWKVAYLHGVDFRGKPMRDTLLIDHLVDENRDHDLDTWVQELFQDDYKAKFWSKYKSYQEAPVDDRLDYGCRDIYYTRRIYTQLLRDLKSQSIPDSIVDHVHRLALALIDTEIEGIGVDMNYTVQMGSELKTDIVRTEAGLRELGGHACDLVELDYWVNEINKRKSDKGRQRVERPSFNFGSSEQVGILLYDKIGLEERKNRKTKRRTVDDKALESLGDAHPILPELRKLRKYSKMYSAFIEGLLEKVDKGRIYPGFNVSGTVTGRISHSEPNMGQLPAKGEWAKIRGIFIPEPGNKLITCDYSQLEVCIAAHFSQDKNLLKIIFEGASKHDITAESLGVPRGLAKTLNFAMQYQCSPKKVAEILNCSNKAAEEAWNKYWETYSGEKAVIDDCKAKVDRGEPIVNPFGRRRHFPSHFKQYWEREEAYRQAYSSLIQGTGSDCTSRSFYKISEALKMNGWGRTWFTVHDEVLAESPPTHVEAVRALIQDVMIQAGVEANLSVPLSVECSDPLDRWVK